MPPSRPHSHLLAPLDTNTNPRRGSDRDATTHGQNHGQGHAHRYSFLATPIEYQGPFTPSQSRRAQTQTQEEKGDAMETGTQAETNLNADVHADQPQSRSRNSDSSIEDVNMETATTQPRLMTVVEEASPRSATATTTAPVTATTTATPMSAHIKTNINSTPSSPPPPLSQHPTKFVPQTATPTVHFPPVPMPTSPAPVAHPHSHPHTNIPHHHTPSEAAQLRREKEWGVVPDNNPLADLHKPSQTTAPTHTKTSQPSQLVPPNTTTNTLQSQSHVHTPGQIRHPRHPIPGGPWTHSLCDPTTVKDPATCCAGLFCPCILYGRTQYRLSQKSAGRDPTNVLGYETCNASCVGMAMLVCGCQCA